MRFVLEPPAATLALVIEIHPRLLTGGVVKADPERRRLPRRAGDIDGKGRVWLTAAVEPPETPGFCRGEPSEAHDGEPHPSAAALPVERSSRHLAVFGWLDTRAFDETGDEAAAQGWTPLVLDTNGNGRRDDYTEGDEPLDPELDRRIEPGYVYGIAPAPDGNGRGRDGELRLASRPRLDR